MPTRPERPAAGHVRGSSPRASFHGLGKSMEKVGRERVENVVEVEVDGVDH